MLKSEIEQIKLQIIKIDKIETANVQKSLSKYIKIFELIVTSLRRTLVNNRKK